MIKVIRKLLQDTINNIDAGNSNVSEDEALHIIHVISDITSPMISKYQACNLLNISRAKFDNLVKDGKMPKGIKRQGFTELFWNKNEILYSLKKITKHN